MNERLIHDCAYAQAVRLLKLVGHLLREEEHRDAFWEFYELSRAGFENYELQVDRLEQRLRGMGSN